MTRVQCECGSEVESKGMGKHRQTKKHKAFLHKQNPEDNVEVEVEEPMVCECGGRYKSDTEKRHYKSKKHIDFVENKKDEETLDEFLENKKKRQTEKRNEKRYTKIQCECGSTYSVKDKSTHQNTNKHIAFMVRKQRGSTVSSQSSPRSSSRSSCCDSDSD